MTTQDLSVDENLPYTFEPYQKVKTLPDLFYPTAPAQPHPIGVKLVRCVGEVRSPRATARVPSPHPHSTRPYKTLLANDTLSEKWVMYRSESLQSELVSSRDVVSKTPISPICFIRQQSLTKKRNSQFPFRNLCKGGCGVERSGDPCGRPGAGLWLLNLMPVTAPTPPHPPPPHPPSPAHSAPGKHSP